MEHGEIANWLTDRISREIDESPAPPKKILMGKGLFKGMIGEVGKAYPSMKPFLAPWNGPHNYVFNGVPIDYDLSLGQYELVIVFGDKKKSMEMFVPTLFNVMNYA